MNARDAIEHIEAAGKEMRDCCDRAEAFEQEVRATMAHFNASRDYAIQMIHWSRDFGAASDRPIAREYCQGR